MFQGPLTLVFFISRFPGPTGRHVLHLLEDRMFQGPLTLVFFILGSQGPLDDTFDAFGKQDVPGPTNPCLLYFQVPRAHWTTPLTPSGKQDVPGTTNPCLLYFQVPRAHWTTRLTPSGRWFGSSGFMSS
jgi:hypothetical protein